MSTPVAPRIEPGVAALRAGATSRTPVRPGDARSGSTFEWLVIDGQRYLLKTVSHATDWIMRVTGDVDQRTFRLWRSGLMHDLPPCLDHAVVAMARDGIGPDAVLGILMREVSQALVPEGDDVVPMARHRAFLDAMAALGAHLAGWRDDLGLMPMERRLRFFAPDVLAPELDRPDASAVVRIAERGWARLAAVDPELHALLASVHRQPGPLVDALARTPATFLHGDWKMGNLGSHPDGRTVLLDWAYPGAGPPCWDLAWYLALNRARLPESKEDAVEAFRAALARHGFDPGDWFDVQLRLCLLGVTATFGWEKALGPDDELDWWASAAFAGARLLGERGP
ncbi:phosphotransferase family protein [Blastococcus deserti]|uniref:Phosphotransferase family protein n=1 Tax=Blastococcus deserti TaxID=2259033 RepID=A0ABW4XD77_9ACTN